MKSMCSLMKVTRSRCSGADGCKARWLGRLGKTWGTSWGEMRHGHMAVEHSNHTSLLDIWDEACQFRSNESKWRSLIFALVWHGSQAGQGLCKQQQQQQQHHQQQQQQQHQHQQLICHDAETCGTMDTLLNMRYATFGNQFYTSWIFMNRILLYSRYSQHPSTCSHAPRIGWGEHLQEPHIW